MRVWRERRHPRCKDAADQGYLLNPQGRTSVEICPSRTRGFRPAAKLNLSVVLHKEHSAQSSYHCRGCQIVAKEIIGRPSGRQRDAVTERFQRRDYRPDSPSCTRCRAKCRALYARIQHCAIHSGKWDAHVSAGVLYPVAPLLPRPQRPPS
jgi:hypothetical protein